MHLPLSGKSDTDDKTSTQVNQPAIRNGNVLIRIKHGAHQRTEQTSSSVSMRAGLERSLSANNAGTRRTADTWPLPSSTASSRRAPEYVRRSACSVRRRDNAHRLPETRKDCRRINDESMHKRFHCRKALAPRLHAGWQYAIESSAGEDGVPPLCSCLANARLAAYACPFKMILELRDTHYDFDGPANAQCPTLVCSIRTRGDWRTHPRQGRCFQPRFR